jgi:hypothetical protein
MLGLANDRKPRHSETTVGDELESLPERYIIIQHRRKTMDEQAIEALIKRITQYLISELDKRGNLVDRVTDLEDTIEDAITEDRVREIASDEAIEAINNAEVNVDISA